MANENGSRPLWVIRASHDLVSDRIASLKSDRERAKVALERARPHPHSNFSHSAVDIEKFGILISEKFTNGDISFRRIILRSIIDGVEVWDKLADSNDFAHLFRFYFAHHSEMMSPG